MAGEDCGHSPALLSSPRGRRAVHVPVHPQGCGGGPQSCGDSQGLLLTRPPSPVPLQNFIKDAMDPPVPSSITNAVEFLCSFKVCLSAARPRALPCLPQGAPQWWTVLLSTTARRPTPAVHFRSHAAHSAGLSETLEKGPKRVELDPVGAQMCNGIGCMQL